MLHVTLRVYHPLFSPLFALHLVILSVSRLNRFARLRLALLAALSYLFPSALLNCHQVDGVAIALLSAFLAASSLVSNAGLLCFRLFHDDACAERRFAWRRRGSRRNSPPRYVIQLTADFSLPVGSSAIALIFREIAGETARHATDRDR